MSRTSRPCWAAGPVAAAIVGYLAWRPRKGVQRRAEGPGPRDTSTPDRRSLPAEAAR
jgi:hypothetical protein